MQRVKLATAPLEVQKEEVPADSALVSRGGLEADAEAEAEGSAAAVRDVRDGVIVGEDALDVVTASL